MPTDDIISNGPAAGPTPSNTLFDDSEPGSDDRAVGPIEVSNFALELRAGYELAPPAPGVPRDDLATEKPHYDGIPPITTRYKDPRYIESATRGSGPAIVNETVLLILVNFTDVAATNRTVSELEMAVFNTTAGGISVHNYYIEVSYGVCNVTPGTLNGAAGGQWLKLPRNRTYYGRDNTSNTSYLRDDGLNPDGDWHTQGKGQLIKDACAAADGAGVNFSEYDNDGPDGIPNSSDDDGIVDHLLIIYSGNGQNHYGTDIFLNSGPDDDGGANDYGRDLVWPSRVFNGSFPFCTYDTKKIITATMNPEDPSFTLPVGVTCHEFGHDLGLPDLYSYTKSPDDVIGEWALMDIGNYNTYGGQPSPAHPTAWCKASLGWVEPINITVANQGGYQINQTTMATNDSVCYLIDLPGYKEYFLIENRNNTIGTYDAGLPGRGLLIYHLQKNLTDWLNSPWNTVGNGGPSAGWDHYAVNIENPINFLDEADYDSNQSYANWTEHASENTFNKTTKPSTRSNYGVPNFISIDRIKDNAFWNMTVRLLISDDFDPPGPPQDVLVYNGEYDNGGIINITWNASNDDGSGDNDVLYYRIYMNDTGGIDDTKILIKTINATQTANYQYNVQGLVNGVTYNFTVRADDGTNLSTWPGNFTATPYDDLASPPTNVTVFDVYPDDGGNVTLNWTLSVDDPTLTGVGVKDIVLYNIYMGQVEGGIKNNIAILGPGNTSYTADKLTNSVKYYFIVSTVDVVANEGNSSEVNATPTDDHIGSPINPYTTPGGWSNASSFYIDWTNPSENSGIVGAYYKLDAVPTDNDDFTKYVPGWDIDWLEVNDTLSDGTHSVYLWLRDGEDNRNYTSAKMVTILYDGTPPASAIGLSAAPTGWSDTNSFTLDWTNPSEVSGVGGVYFSINEPPRHFNDGVLTQGNNINQLTGITLPTQGENTIYIWLRDKAKNADHTTNVSIKVYLDISSPDKPMNIQAIPDTWTITNSFDITWTNPPELSGIIGARYKMDGFPQSNNDGIYMPGDNISSIQDIRVSYAGSHRLYLWLVDNASNTYFLNHNTTILYFDNNPPKKPYDLLVSPLYWTSDNSFDINWTNQYDHSGIAGVFYKFNSAPSSAEDGVYLAGNDIDELVNLTAPSNGTQTVYIWLMDGVGNIDHLNHSYIYLYYDSLSPDAPIDLTPHPTNIWTNNNDFTVTWLNPDEHSGIAGVYYKLGSPPTENTDGKLVKKTYLNMIDDITVPGSGVHTVYVWLLDKMGNVNYINRSSVKLYFDDQPPEPPVDLSVTPSGWTSANRFDISWTNPPDHSGIYGLYYWFSEPTENIGSLIIKDNISSIKALKIPGDNPPSREYSIYIWLIDNAYNIDYTKNNSAKLLYDLNAPLILHSRVYYAIKGLPITITAMITERQSDVKEVKLFYKHESDNNYSAINMDRTGGSIFTGKIVGSFVTDESIGYYLYASDNSVKPNKKYYGEGGSTFTRPGDDNDININITETDMIPPTVIHQKITTGIAGVTIALVATVIDDGSGVKEVKVFYKESSEKTFNEGRMIHGDPYFFELPGSVVSFAGVDYYLGAVDNSPAANEMYFGNYGQTTIRPHSDDSYIKIKITSEDDSPPLIIYGPEVIKITSSSATMFWITDEPADSGVLYGTTDNMLISGFNKTYTTFHTLVLSGLAPDTNYYYKVSSTDKKGNGPTQSNIYTFQTTKIGDEDFDGDGVPDSVDSDDDNDGMYDSWEVQYGLNPKDNTDANLDSDMDGYSNLLEFLSGSDPNDPDSTRRTVQDTTPPVIIHEPRKTATLLETFTITALVYDNGSGVRNVTLNFKKKPNSEYSSVAMYKISGDQNTYKFELPREMLTRDDLEYYIEAEDWASVPNVIFYGKTGMTQVRPTAENDINIDVREKSTTESEDDDDGDFFEQVGKPFGLTDAGICLVVLIIVIVLIICFVLALRSAFQAREISKQNVRSKSKTADGDKIYWDGEEAEELEEVEDLIVMGDEVEEEEQEGL